MPLNLQSLTNSSTSGDILAEIGSAVNSFEYVAALKNLATESDALPDATQPVSVLQGTSIQSKGLYLPGTTGNEAVVPNSADIDPTGDLDLRVEYEHADGFEASGLIGKQYTTNYYFRPDAVSGRLRFWRNLASVFSTVNLPNTDRRWVRVTHRVSDDRVQFFTSSDGEVWEQLGDDLTIAANTPTTSTVPLYIGSLNGNNQNLHGVVYKAQVYASIDGTDKRLDIDFTSNNIEHGATSFTADSGQVVTINQSGDDVARISKGSHLIMDLVDDEYEFTTDSAINGTIVVATLEGTYSAGISLDADTTYKLQARGVSDQSNTGLFKNIVGYLISSTPLSEGEISSIESYFVSKGASPRSAFGSVTNFNDTWRGCSTITTFPLIDTSNGSFYQTWRDCSSLVSFPLIDTTGASSVNQTWLGCSSLSSFPLIDTSSITYFGYGWMNCTSIKSFPLIDTSLGTNFTNAWYNCNSFTSFPLLDTSLAEILNSTWRGCYNLSSFPLIDTSSVENFTGAWQDCSSLSSFPLIDASAATTANRTWFNCNSLTSFPAIDFPLSQDFFQAWSKCSTLTSFPQIDVSTGKRFTLAWQTCSNLTTFPAGLFDNWSPPSLFDQVFNETWGSCTSLTPQSVENILVSIAASGVYGTDTGLSSGTQLVDNEIDIDYDGGNLSTATTTAITNLKTKNWVIVINSVTQ